jgi:integrase
MKRQAEDGLKLGLRLDKTALLFPRSSLHPTEPRNPDNDSVTFARAAARRGFACSLHNLRHAYGSILLAAGASLKDVSQRMGHADVATTLREYQTVLKAAEQRTTALAAELGL